MATVYQRLLEYKKANNFNFPQKHKMMIGTLVAKNFRIQGGVIDHLDVIESIEDNGTRWMVPDYPKNFTSDIDKIISDYVKRITSPTKNIIEKPAPSRPVPDPISSSLPPKKTRTRKPIQKPHFSGKPLMKK